MSKRYRNRPTRDYTVVRNAALRNPALSLKAKGALAMMLTFPGDWEYHLTHLEALSRDGRDALRAAIRELEDAGYITRHQTRKPDGTLGDSEYHVTDDVPTVAGKPVRGAKRVQNGKSTADGLSVAGQTVAGQTVAGKPATKKTDYTKTDLTNNTPLPPKPEDETDSPTVEGMGWTGTDRTQTRFDATNHLCTFHQRAHRALIDFRRMHDKPIKDAQFKQWAGSVLDDVRDHGESPVVEALGVTIDNFPSLRSPFSFYRKVLENTATAPIANGGPTTPLPDAITDLIEQAKAGTL